MSSLRDRLRRQLGTPKPEPAPEPLRESRESAVEADDGPSVGERLQTMFRRSGAARQTILRTGRARSVEPAAQGGASLGAPRFTAPRGPRPTDPSRPPTPPPALAQELRGDDGGAWFHCTAHLPAGHRHGAIPLDDVLDVDGRGAVLLSGDPALADFDPTEALFFDLETTGLMGGGGNLAFIVGVATVDAEGAVDLTQFLLREPGDEAALLDGVRPLIERARCLVSFNGKSFDRHVLADRFVMNRMDGDLVLDKPHLDLIHPARRLYRSSGGGCGLGALEERCLRVFRDDDLPGSEAPAAWFAWLRTGDRKAVRRVQDHNALDLISLVGLTAHLHRCVVAPGAALPDPRALVQAGRLLVERGDHRTGEEVLRLVARGDASDPVVYGALHVLGEHLRRGRRYDEAVSLWQRMRLAAGLADVHPWIALAIAFEHRLGRTGDALDLVDELWARQGEGYLTAEQREDLERRRERLQRKAARA